INRYTLLMMPAHAYTARAMNALFESPKHMKLWAAVFVLALLLPWVTSAQSPAATKDLAGMLRAQLISAESHAHSSAALDWPTLRDFYLRRGYHSVWLNATTYSPRAQQLLQTLWAASDEGLEPAAYHLSSIELKWGSESLAERASLELLLTDALARYSIHMQTGRLQPKAVDPDWYIEKPKVNAVHLLPQLLAADDFTVALSALKPSHIAYRRLRGALAQHRQLQAEGGWPVIPSGPRLELGSVHEQVALLRARLKIEADLLEAQPGDGVLFDETVGRAVKRFQQRHGIASDGVVGPQTRAAMNVPIAKRIEQIKLNMERWRWLPKDLGKRHILVNTAGYELTVMEGDESVLAMQVIVGQPRRSTPTISGVMNSVVFNPTWTVPLTIAVEDLVPKQLHDPTYLQSLNIRVFDGYSADAAELDPAEIDWRRVSKKHFPYRLVQDPGPGNSLGRIKFSFSNRFDIFLHDTPDRSLFAKHARALSSGCIRVKQPQQLANYLLRGKKTWTNDKIEETIASHETVAAGLSESLPIYLVYWTAWVDADG
ncbi:MAG TPA: hypothetical protein EYP31_05400, partial [Roseibacterium sp.]|nr:hypothetical protein [Roseibacterium sp.]